MITLEIVLDKCNKKFNYWKFNNLLLKEVEFVNLIKKRIKEVTLQYADIDCFEGKSFELVCKENIKFCINDQLFFDTLLMELRAASIIYSIER